ncbi:MAG: hypothetical protein ACERKO_08985 [Acetanaerobacterium sp.]
MKRVGCYMKLLEKRIYIPFITAVLILCNLTGCTEIQPTSSTVNSIDVLSGSDTVISSSRISVDSYNESIPEEDPWKNKEVIIELSTEETNLGIIVNLMFEEFMQQQYMSEDIPENEQVKSWQITDIKLYGDINEFAAEVTFDLFGGDHCPFIAGGNGEEETGSVNGASQGMRIRKIDNNKYGLIGFGNGAIALGLSPIDE